MSSVDCTHAKCMRVLMLLIQCMHAVETANR